MPRPSRYSERLFLDITPAMKRQLARLSLHHEKSIPELVRSAVAAAYGLPSDQDRQPQLLDQTKTSRTSARPAKSRPQA